MKINFLSVAHIHSKSYCKDLAESGDLGLIWDDNAERGARYAAEFGVTFEPDLDKALADSEADGFVVCTENTKHLPILEKAMPVGKPILCEKPLATSRADADAIEALAKRYPGTPLSCGYVQPFLPSNRGAMKLMESGELGKVTHLFFRNAHNAAYGRWFDSPDLQWFTEPSLSGGGGLLDMGTHATHLLRHMGGPVEKVWAMTANFAGTYPKVEDYGVIMIQFKNGIIGRVEGGWVFTGGHGGLEVIGSKKSVWNENGRGLVMNGEGNPAIAPGDSRPDRMNRIRAMVRGELSGEELANDFQCCLDAAKITAAAYESAKSGAWVAL